MSWQSWMSTCEYGGAGGIKGDGEAHVEGIDFIVGQLILLQELLHQCRPPLAGLQGLQLGVTYLEGHWDTCWVRLR